MKPFEVKAQLIERQAHCQEKLVAQKFEFLEEIKAVENFYADKHKEIVASINELANNNEELLRKIEDQKRRLSKLEGKQKPEMSQRYYKPNKAPMLAEKINIADFEEF